MERFIISDCKNINDVHEAPENNGIYVWYARLNIGKAVYDDACAGGTDKASEETNKAVMQHVYKHAHQPLKISASANFSVSWAGNIESYYNNLVNSNSATVIDEQYYQKSVEKAVANHQTRSVFLDLIKKSFPIFSSPLYIGIATDQTLRERLLSHKNIFMSCWERTVEDLEYPQRLKNPKNFGERAIKIGLRPSDLFFYTMHIIDETISNQEKKNIIESAEWVLNRCASPILGKK
jgi:hypothetical protein